MPETKTPATELASQYIAQVTGDLEANLKEQERIGTEITTLQEQLAALQHDHDVLKSMQQALGITAPPNGSAAESESAVLPSPRRKKAGPAAGEKQKARKSTATPAKKAARKPAAGRPAAAKQATGKPAAEKPAVAKPAAKKPAVKSTDSAKAPEPTLVELIRRHLAEQKEPRSAAEISTALGEAHPHRGIAAKVVRVTLEGLVAKSQAERSKQGRSVFYTAPASEPAAASETEAQPQGADS
jgi:cell division septum initiation protein DivIVA